MKKKLNPRAAAVIADAQVKAKVPAHTLRGNAKPGQKFDGDRFAELCVKRKIDPAEAALKLLQDPAALSELKAKEKLDAYIRLMEYAYPKKRATEAKVEHSGTIEIAERPKMTREEWMRAHGLSV